MNKTTFAILSAFLVVGLMGLVAAAKMDKVDVCHVDPDAEPGMEYPHVININGKA